MAPNKTQTPAKRTTASSYGVSTRAQTSRAKLPSKNIKTGKMTARQVKDRAAKASSAESLPPKRGLIDEDDDYDPTESLQVIRTSLGRRATKNDKFMLGVIEQIGKENSTAGLDWQAVQALFAQERFEASKGKPLNCHAKVYWRFRRLLESCGMTAHPRHSTSEDDVIESIEQSQQKSTSRTQKSKRPKTSTVSVTNAQQSAGRALSESLPSHQTRNRSEPTEHFNVRFQDPDAYGKHLRSIEQTAYIAHKKSREQSAVPGVSLSADFKKYTGRLQWGDFERAQSRGIQRAIDEASMNEADSSEQDILRVDYAGIIQPQRGPSRGHTLSQAEGSSTRKPSMEFARTPEKSNIPGRGHGQKRSTSENNADDSELQLCLEEPGDSELQSRPEERRRGRPEKVSTPAAKSTPAKPNANARSTASGAKAKVTDEPAPKCLPSGKGRGNVISAANPRYIPGTKRPNPFYETMPATEIWHRHMAPYFPFGETPFMERVMSNQINEDLARSDEKYITAQKSRSFIEKGKEHVGSFFRRTQTRSAESRAVQQAKKYTASPWDLPEVEDEDVDRFLHGDNSQGSSNSRKRLASTVLDSGAKSAKIAQMI